MSRWIDTIRRFLRESCGAAMVEFTIVIFALILVTGTVVDGGFAFFQWNAATKALQQGARLAAVSSPVSSDLASLSGLEGGALPGDPFPSFVRVCNGAAQSCSNGGTYSAAAMDTLVWGRGDLACGTVAAGQLAGMCDVFWRVGQENVIVTYRESGMGFAGRPGGPVPTITLELTGLTFSPPFLGSVLGIGPIAMPPMRTSVTGEDLSTTVASPAGGPGT